MKNLVRIAAILSLVTLFAIPAAAQNGKKTGEFGVDVDWITYSDVPVEDGPGMRLRVGWGFTKRWGMEFQYTRYWTDSTEDPPRSIDTNAWGLNLLYNFHPTPRDVPFVFVGLRREDFSGAKVEPTDIESWEIGGGWRRWFNHRFGMRVDLSANLRGEDSTIWDALMVEEVDFRASAGLSVSLGKKENLEEAAKPTEKKKKEKKEKEEEEKPPEGM